MTNDNEISSKKLTDKEKVQYFDDNLHKIFSSKKNISVSFITECLKNTSNHNLLKTWPSSLKINIVDNFLEI